MKKIIALMVVTSMLTLASCGDNASKKETDDSAIESSQSKSGDTSESEQEESISESEEENKESFNEEKFYNFNNLNMLIPEKLTLINFSDATIWGQADETAEDLYYAIIYNGLNYSDYNDPATYSSENVWEILNYKLEDNIGHVYYDIAEFYDAEVDTTEQFEFMSTEFIHTTGVVSFRKYDDAGGGTDNVNYSACYGVLDFPAYDVVPEFKSVPFMWIAFSDSDSDEIKTEMEKIVDDVAENASWISD